MAMRKKKKPKRRNPRKSEERWHVVGVTHNLDDDLDDNDVYLLSDFLRVMKKEGWPIKADFGLYALDPEKHCVEFDGRSKTMLVRPLSTDERLLYC